MIISKDEYDRQLRNEGREEAIVSFAKNALELNLSDKDIIDICEISQEQLEHIKADYKAQQNEDNLNNSINNTKPKHYSSCPYLKDKEDLERFTIRQSTHLDLLRHALLRDEALATKFLNILLNTDISIRHINYSILPYYS